MDYKFADIVDIPAIQELMESLWQASGIPVGIVDIEGRVLVATGWQEICTRFHRRNPETEQLCRESDAFLQHQLRINGISDQSGSVEYKCKNGMIDIAVPIVIEGRHLASLFLGQFFYQPPDEVVFREQARVYGFDEAAYLQALKRVPIFTRQKVLNMLDYHRRLVDLMAQTGVQKIEWLEAQAALRESEERFRSVFESAAAPMAILSPEGKLLQVNPATCQLFDLSMQELLGLQVDDLLHPDDRGRNRPGYQELLSGTRQAVSFEKRYRRRDGSTVWGHATLAAVRNAAGELLYLVALMQDITESKHREQELVHREAFEALLTGISTRFVELPARETDLGIDQALEDLGRLVGVDRSYVFLFSGDGALMDNSHEWCAESIVPQKENLRRIASSELAWALQKTLDRQILYVPSVAELPAEAATEQAHWQSQGIQSLVTVPILIAGQAAGFLGFDAVRAEMRWDEQDIDLLQTIGNLFGNAIERQRTEKAQQESERKLATLMHNLPGMAYRCRNDQDWTMLFVSEGCRALTGYRVEDLLDNREISYAALIHPEDREYAWQQVQIALGLKRPFQLEYRIRTATGVERWVWEQGMGVFDQDGELLGIEGFISDITEHQKALETLRLSDRMKTEFVKTVAHEIRTPLTAILGFSELVLTNVGITSQERQESLRYIYERSLLLAEMVDDMLDIARIESGAPLSLKIAPCSVADIFQQMEFFLKSQVSLHPLEIKLAAEATLLQVDKGKMAQVLENLLCNAVKFSAPKSLVRIEGGLVDGAYQILVVDQGIGMTPEQVDKVFDKFYRADASDTAAAGVGLGMSIVKHIVEGHGGSVRVESELQRGTRVSFTIPLKRCLSNYHA